MSSLKSKYLEVTDLTPQIITYRNIEETDFPRRLSSSAATVEVLQKYRDHEGGLRLVQNIWKYLTMISEEREGRPETCAGDEDSVNIIS